MLLIRLPSIVRSIRMSINDKPVYRPPFRLLMLGAAVWAILIGTLMAIILGLFGI